jgi:hypothetical protein
MKSAIRKILDYAEKDPRTNRPSLISEEEARKLARRVLRQGKPIGEELRKAGFAPRQARKGMRRVQESRTLRRAFLMEKDAIIKGPSKEFALDVEQAEGLIVDRLKKNIKAGTDKAVMSAKLLGSHKKLNLWQPENQTGIIVINTPTDGTDFSVPSSKVLPQSDE